MTESSTPRTDAAPHYGIADANGVVQHWYIHEDVPKELESELAEAKLGHKDWIIGVDGRLHCPCHFAAESRLAGCEETLGHCRTEFRTAQIRLARARQGKLLGSADSERASERLGELVRMIDATIAQGKVGK
jgi:hypothetical protein